MSTCEHCGAEVFTACRLSWVEMPAGEVWSCTKQIGHEGKCGIDPEAHTLLKCRDILSARLKDMRYVLSQVSAARDILVRQRLDRLEAKLREPIVWSHDDDDGCPKDGKPCTFEIDLELDDRGNVATCTKCGCRDDDDKEVRE